MSLLKRAQEFSTPVQIVLKETYYDVAKLQRMASIDVVVPGGSYVKDMIWSTEVDKMKRMLKNKKKDNTNTLTYVRPLYERGRYMATKSGKNEPSYQNVYNKARRLVMDGMYHDIDMVNAHPSILVQLCDDLNIECPKLRTLVENRDAYLQEIMTKFDVSRDVAKNFFTSTCFGESLNGWAVSNGIKDTSKAPGFMLEFINEHESIRRKFTSIPEYLDYVQIATRVKGKTGRKKEVSTMAIMLQDVESKVIICMYNFMVENNIHVSTLIHDGILVYKNEKVTSDLLRACEQRITYTLGLKIKLDEKNTAPTDDDIAWFKEHEPFMRDIDGKNSDVRIDQLNCNNILSSFQGKVFRTDLGLMMYDKEEGIWTNVKTDHYRIIERDCKLVGLSEKDTFKKLFNDAYTLLESKAAFKTKWYAIEDDLGYLCFNNGVLDMKEYKMLPHDPKYFFTKKINRNFDCEDMVMEKEELMTRVFEKPFNDKDKLERYMCLLSRGVAGYSVLRDKSFNICIGEPNCGKGLQCRLFDHSLDGYYDEFNAEHLSMAKKKNDIERDWSFALKFYNCRIACSSELILDTTDTTTKFGTKKDIVKLNGNCMKRLVGEGDVLNGRGLYKDPFKFVNRAMLNMMVNDIPEVAPADKAFLNRVNYIQFDKCSSDEITEDNEEYFVADSTIKSYVKQESTCNAFISLMCSYFQKTLENPDLIKQTEEMKALARERTGAGMSGFEWVKRNYQLYEGDVAGWEKPGSKTTTYDWDKVGDWFMCFDTVYEFYTSAGNIDSKTNFGMLLKKGGLGRADKKIKGKTKSVIVGLRVYREVVEFVEDEDDN